MSLIRTRWAAVGAAVAITLGAGGIGLVSATNPAGALTFIPITPCRVIDTRPAPDNVGPRSSPLGPGEVHTVRVHGSNGNCAGIPTTAKAVSLNVTAVDATQPTFLTLWATGKTQPTASSLNPTPGQPPAPNAVTTNLDNNGRFNIYNLQGNVHVLADINGYYTDHNHDDRYYTKAQTDASFARAPIGSITIPIASFIRAESQTDPSEGWSFVGSYWRHSESSPVASQCIAAPVDLPVGAVVTSVDVSYVQQAAAPIPVTIAVGSTVGLPGVYADDYDILKYHLYRTANLAPTSISEVARVNVTNDAAALAAEGIIRSPILELASPSIELCVEADISLLDVGVNFDLP